MSTQVVEYDTAAAERRAERIRLRLDSIADNITTVLPMIREAIEKGDPAALGYNGISDYVADRFGSALSRLPVDLRRPVHHELRAAGMSTRAIASVTGVGSTTVKRDIAGGPSGPPDVDHTTGEILTPSTEATTKAEDVEVEGPGEAAHGDATPAVRPVIGIDGKTYTRKPATQKTTTPRRPLPDQFFDAAYDMGKAIERVARLTEDDRFPQNVEKVAAKHRNDLIHCRDLLQQVIDRLA